MTTPATTTRIDRVNILLVDDQPAKLLSYETVLSSLGETLLTATSATEALECLLKNEVAVVLVDVCMPDLDGYELAAMIRQHPRFQQTAIIFVSAVMLNDLDRLRGYECGAVDYVPVPVVPEILRAKVSVFADLYRKTRALERLNSELEERVAERTSALEATTAALQDADRRKDEFLAMLAHELRNPLAPIRTAVQLLRLKELGPPPECARTRGHRAAGRTPGDADRRPAGRVTDHPGHDHAPARTRTGGCHRRACCGDGAPGHRRPTPRLDARTTGRADHRRRRQDALDSGLCQHSSQCLEVHGSRGTNTSEGRP